MRRRWARRLAVQLAAIGPTWVVAVLVDRVDIDGNATVMAVALVALALAGMWVRYGSFDRMST